MGQSRGCPVERKERKKGGMITYQGDGPLAKLVEVDGMTIGAMIKEPSSTQQILMSI